VPGAADDGYQPRDADDGPLFFLSYAHSPRDDRTPDPDLWIGKLYDDLCDHIKQLADLPPGKKAGFMDRELRQGQEWPERLSEALASCSVFVPLYSRRYFKSEHCGKEWFAFNRRRLNHRAKNTHPVETIVPALWIPAANSDNQQHDVNEHFVLKHFFGQMKLYAAIVSSRPA